MSATKRVFTERPVYTRLPVRKIPGTSSTNNATSRARTAEHTTTTNVVSVVCEAAHMRRRESTHMHTHANTAADLLQNLRLLPEAERKQILDQLLLDKMESAATSGDRDAAMWAEAVHREFTRSIGSVDGGLVGLGVVRKVVSVGTAFAPIRAFMDSSGLRELSVTERQRAYYMLAELLVRHAKVVARRSGAPFSVKLVSQCAANISGVFESAFPGYLEAGLARVVARQPEAVGV